jgi:DNA-directed RNA polymerase specialized sigma24 family protein
MLQSLKKDSTEGSMSLGWKNIVDVIGEEAANKLRSVFKGEIFLVPKTLPARIVAPLVLKDLKTMNYSQIAKKHGLSESTIRRYEKRMLAQVKEK